uniref:Helitron helicase-like domain-containing protein n=1 Tax=Amphimedon queenslandica TaxID=400682 RepID=A0A1X7V245_AMPQE
YIIESKQVLDDANNFIWRQRPYDSGITAAQARDPRCLKEYVRKDKAYRFIKNIRGSPPYYQRTFYDLLAMDYAVRVEFQLRGSPHAHCVIWIKDAPKFGVDPEEKVCEMSF